LSVPPLITGKGHALLAGIRPNAYYAWLKDSMATGKSLLQTNTARDATLAEAEAL
jgi:hypothetical protein